ncbi:Dolichyl-diphosphooligosaccharide--protein glycosyltransferase subunit 1 [Cryptotermes secundus]|uniref:Dolichyl-diphosphooligosaccharide--protein glycosyltransferase subunit 1 n=2 Tax=Cryptotermes secundus TaxID=105785 RepID=A0A2J7PLA1_9NEOP|nr:Dolichyl-diphosphooligosaccharide--protein glycosyltransferase subunit 1 [Cryptotermes secundus]
MKDALKHGETAVVDVETVYTHQLTPHPASITQKEKQLVLYHGNHYFYTPYPVTKQSTVVNLGTRSIESYTKLKPTSQSDYTIMYGPYENIPPFSIDKMSVHYENNAPFLTITNLERVIEVSHWGNIAVEETIDLKHSGATLKGPFSRYEYQRETQSGLSSVKSFKTILPAAATDAYYRDEIGNISTSHMKILSDSVELDLRPRFPLFGGWKTHYVIGYNVPSYEYLFNRGDDYLLRMRFLDHVFDDMIVDEVITKIILPEGSQDIQLTTPYPVEHLPNSLHFTYLDTKGRPVIMLRKKNLVENHIQDFELQYKFPRILMLQEPFLVVLAFYLLFLFVIIYVRLDFSITKDEAGESRMRVAGYCEKILAHQDKRAITYTSYSEQLAKLKLSKDINAFLASVKNINHEHKNETAHIAELLVKLKADSADLAEKVSELQKADKHLKDLYTQHQSLYVDKLVPGKIARQAFVDTENQLNKKKEDCVEKINTLVKSLQ